MNTQFSQYSSHRALHTDLHADTEDVGIHSALMATLECRFACMPIGVTTP